MQTPIKLLLTALFFMCLLNMPYGFYQLTRFVAMAGFGILSLTAYKQGRQTETVIYAALGILFQPVFKIALGRELWNIVDVITGIGLLISIFIKQKRGSFK